MSNFGQQPPKSGVGTALVVGGLAAALSAAAIAVASKPKPKLKPNPFAGRFARPAKPCGCGR